jgi:hypothetical protein
MDIGHFAPGIDSMDSDAEIENHERKFICKHHWFEKDLENH